MNLIVAVDEHWGIGRNGKLLTSIPGDMKFFRETTMGKTVVMGRSTLESFPDKKPLTGRVNIVLTGNMAFEAKGAVIVHSVKEALAACEPYEAEDVFVIGGGQVYEEFLPYCDTAYITKIEYTFDADTFFPNLDENPEWSMTKESDEMTCFDLIYRFTKYERVTK